MTQPSAPQAEARQLQTPRTDAGFTLIEVMVALFILSLVSLAGVSMLVVAANGSDQLRSQAEFLRTFETARAALRSDLGQAVARPTRDSYGGVDSSVFRGGFEGAGGPLLAFVRLGWENPDGAEARGGLLHVEYLVEDGALIRRTRDRVDPTLDTPVSDTVLLTGVRGLTIAFGSGGDWTLGWDAASVRDPSRPLPDFVEIELDLESVGMVRQLFLLPRSYLPDARRGGA